MKIIGLNIYHADSAACLMDNGKLLSAIESLPDTQRIAYTLHNMEDFSYKEIAELMQVSVSSVESLIFRAKKNLKSKLEVYFKNN